MKLYLARHGEYIANDPRQGEVLTEKGVLQLKRLTNFISPANLSVNAIYHSNKPRALQSAEILAKGFKCKKNMEVRKGLQPLDEVRDLGEDLISINEDVLLVGHLPFLSKIVGQLVIGDENKELIFIEPGTLICLETHDISCFTIKWVLNHSLFL